MRYKRVYQDFMDWRQKNNSQSFSEQTLLAFFEEKKAVLAPSTLWSIYLILKSTLLSYQNVDLLLYPKLIPFLKRNAVGYQPKKALIFRHEDLDQFFINGSNDDYLMWKVIFSIFF
jgi:hypothetical protein